MTKHLLVFGPGYAARPIMARAKKECWQVTATYRNEDSREHLADNGYDTVHFRAGQLSAGPPVSHVLSSVAPRNESDPVLAVWHNWLKRQNHCSLHYFSSTNIYGDRGGAWVDETSKPEPSLDRGKRRLAAETEWLKLAAEMAVPAFIYRLAGIYGPERNSFTALKNGKAQMIIKPGQVFSRIHRDDIVQTVWKAMTGSHEGGIFNLADDMPTPPQEITETAATMLGVPVPPAVSLEDAGLSAMGKSFYAENKRVRNAKIKRELDITLLYPTYKQGLAALLKEME